MVYSEQFVAMVRVCDVCGRSKILIFIADAVAFDDSRLARLDDREFGLWSRDETSTPCVIELFTQRQSVRPYLSHQLGYVNGRFCVQSERHSASNPRQTLRQRHEHYQLVLDVCVNAPHRVDNVDELGCSLSARFSGFLVTGSKRWPAQRTIRRRATPQSNAKEKHE